jgi:hypothetical protein
MQTADMNNRVTPPPRIMFFANDASKVEWRVFETL